MNPNKRTSALIRLASKILASWKTSEEQQFPGVRFDNGDARWSEGYGVPMDDELPDFVKKDNDGWDYVTPSKNK